MNLSPLPPPPTDNLYKFQALSGLVMLSLTVWFLFDCFEKLDLNRQVLLHDVAILKVETDHFGADENDLNSRKESLLKMSTTNSSPDAALRIAAELRETAEQLKKQSLELKIKAVDLDYKNDLLALDGKRAAFYWIVVVCAIPLLLSWTWLGFRNWQTRIQDYQDSILQNEAEKYPATKSKKGRDR
jgi:hypothetical protein